MAYWNSIVDQHSLRPCFVFSSEFVSSTWSSETHTHSIQFAGRAPGESSSYEAEVLISAAGALNTPIIPTLPGMDTFKGEQFHSSRWNNDLDLKGKAVAIVGNGSSGIQVVPNIAGIEGIKITQFIRSPGYFTPKVRSQFSVLL